MKAQLVSKILWTHTVGNYSHFKKMECFLKTNYSTQSNERKH